MTALSNARPAGVQRILLVEDDAITARYVRNCLRSAGFPSPAVATTAEQALSLACVDPPDVVLMDIALPGAMDGIEAAGVIRERTGAQVLFLTACDEEALRRRATAVGASDYLVKPFLERELCAAVERALRRAGADGAEPVTLGDNVHPLPAIAAAATPWHAPAPRTTLTAQPSMLVDAAPAEGPVRGWDSDGAYHELCALAEELQRQNAALAHAHTRLQAERQRYRSLLEVAPTSCIVTDCAGVILHANHDAGRLLGVDAALLCGKPLSVFIPFGGHQDYYLQLDQVVHHRQRRQWKTTLRPRAGQPFLASLTIVPIQDPESDSPTLCWSIRDLSVEDAAERAMQHQRDSLEATLRERTAELMQLTAMLQSEIAQHKRTEEALRESRQYLQSIADKAPSLLYAYDLQERSLTYANSHVAAYLGCSADVLRGFALRAAFDRVHPDDHLLAERHRDRMLRAADGEVVESTLRVRHADGEWRWIRLRDVVAERDAAGAPLRCVGAAEDVTEQQAAQAALIRAERLADAGRLAASFAHEINNPLQGVLGCLSLLEEALAEGRDAHRFLDVAQHEVRRAVRVVGQLRDLGRQARAPVERGAVDLRELVTHVVAVTEKRSADQGVRMTWQPPPTMLQVVADADAIQQVFLNLVINALDAMPSGGTLRIEAQTTTSPQGVRIAFADDGPGIDPDLLPRLFESFSTTKPEGLGLGLYICRSIVERHAGHIDVETHPGDGTTFSVWLPAQADYGHDPDR